VEDSIKSGVPATGSSEWYTHWQSLGWDGAELQELAEEGRDPADPTLLPWEGLPEDDEEQAPSTSQPFVPLADIPFKPREIAIAPFIRQGDLVFLTGERGTGKTTLAADIIWSSVGDSGPVGGRIGAGALVANRDLLYPRTVAILDGENEGQDWTEALNDTALARGLALDSPEVDALHKRVLHCPSEEFSLDPSEPEYRVDMTRLVDALVEINCGLFIIDPLHSIYTTDLNSPEWVTKGLGPLRKMCRSRGITVIALAHTSRASKDKPLQNTYLPAYTSKQENEVDCCIGLNRNKKENKLTLVLVKRRAAKWNIEGSKAHLYFSLTFGGYSSCNSDWLFENPNKDQTIVMSDAQQRILCSAYSKANWTFEMLDGDRAQVSRAVKKIFIPLELCAQVGGTGKKGDPRVYALTEKGVKLAEFYLHIE